MPDYKHRKIELTPRQQADGTWHCPYRIIEFRPTSWSYHSGVANNSFASQKEAEAAALVVAKRIVDSLESSTQVPQSEPTSLGGMFGDRMSRLAFYLPNGVENLGRLGVRRRTGS